MEDNSLIKELLVAIEANYISNAVYHLKETDKIILGHKNQRVCRFCKKSEPEVTFKKIAHAIPELVNNKTLLCYYECDACNENFSKLETHFADYMNLYHTLTQVRGKKGVPTYKYGKSNSRIDLKDKYVQFEDHISDNESIFKINKKDKSVSVTGKRSYVPIAVYKCLVKMAVSIMREDDLQYFEDTIEWLNEPDLQNSKFTLKNLVALHTFTPGIYPHSFTSAILFKRKTDHKDNVPFMQFMLAYANFSFQIYLPLASEDEKLHGSKILIFPIPTPLDSKLEKGIEKRRRLDLSSPIQVKGEKISAEMGYEFLEKQKVEGVTLRMEIEYQWYRLKKIIRKLFERKG